MSKKIVVGSRVSWVAKPFGQKAFNCAGVVKEIKMNTFGSCARKMGARVHVVTSAYKRIYGRSWTIVAFDKLSVVE